MTIAEILELPVNKSVLGTFVVKTVKKLWEDTDGWMNQVVLSDSTGEMLADFHVVTYSPIQRGVQVELIQAMTQHGEKDLRLYVEEWKQAGEPISEPSLQGEGKIVRSKIKCLLTAAYIQHYGVDYVDLANFLSDSKLNKIIEEIMK